MDYVVGSVAALISGNVTPNRPKLIRRALTPTKHQPSPNVTPKSEFVDDRSIFLSPTQQKKKAIVKKSPKRIFQNPDLDVTEDGDGNTSVTSPKAEKVKKHLKDDLEADAVSLKKSKTPIKTPEKISEDITSSKIENVESSSGVTLSTPKKKKNKRNSESNVAENDSAATGHVEQHDITGRKIKSPKKKLKTELPDDTKQLSSQDDDISTLGDSNKVAIASENKKNKKKKNKKQKSQQNAETIAPVDNKENCQIPEECQQNQSKKKKKKNKSKIKAGSKETKHDEEMVVENQASESDSEEVPSNNIPNPNAITEKDSDSEHDSDNEIESENEEANEKVFNENEENDPQSSDDEEEVPKPKQVAKQSEKKNPEKEQEPVTEDEIKRTLFVGNVPFSKKCKKEMKKIFGKYGKIDTIRIRTIPVKDGRVTPKLAVIKNELHPDRSTVNVYVKFADPASVGQALAENNTVVDGKHLRVSRSDSTGAEHDPRCAVFVGNLPFAVEDEVLRAKFQQCGEISSVRIIRDKKTNAGKGFGYINFASRDGVELALQLSEEDLTIKNRILRVKRCTQGHKNQGAGGKWGQQGAGRSGGQQRSGGNGGPQRSGGNWNQQRSGGNWNQQRSGNNRGQQGPGGNPGTQGAGGKGWNRPEPEGAARRLMQKRKFQESSGADGPPNKRQRELNQPIKEKKQRKEFVGMTAEKKKAPLPAPAWHGVYRAVHDHYFCPQYMELGFIGTEDCLRLNVYVPARTQKPLPVMVYIHGGAFAFGSGGRMVAGPEFLVARDVILVTLNYRLGALGFLCLGIEEAPGNAGLKDQLAALRWINRNIAAFGGDPDNVTLFGQSAGSITASVLMNSDAARGLFRRVIAQSGASVGFMTTMDGLKIASSVANFLGYNSTDPRELYDFYMRLPLKDLVSFAPPALEPINELNKKNFIFCPCIEKKFPGIEPVFTELPSDIIEKRPTNMSVIYGFNDQEGMFMTAHETDETLRAYNHQRFNFSDLHFASDEEADRVSDEIKKFYFGGAEISKATQANFTELLGDYLFDVPTILESEMMVNRVEAPIYNYHFTYAGGRNLLKVRYMGTLDLPGASHADELLYLFTSFVWPYPINERDQKVIDTMTKLWTNFAKYGDPTPSWDDSIPVNWEPSTKDSFKFLYIGEELSRGLLPGPRRHVFWRDLYTRYRKRYD